MPPLNRAGAPDDGCGSGDGDRGPEQVVARAWATRSARHTVTKSCRSWRTRRPPRCGVPSRRADHRRRPGERHRVAEEVAHRATGDGQVGLLGPSLSGANKHISRPGAPVGLGRSNHCGRAGQGHRVGEVLSGRAVGGGQLGLLVRKREDVRGPGVGVLEGGAASAVEPARATELPNPSFAEGSAAVCSVRCDQVPVEDRVNMYTARSPSCRRRRPRWRWMRRSPPRCRS